MAKSFQERRKEKLKASFIGRSELISTFSENLASNDPFNIFNIYGQGGVGKSYLVNQYKNISEENNCLTCYSDESVKSVLQWMDNTAEQFKKKNIELTEFEKRYKTYLQEIKKLETDPEKPKGTLGGLVKAASRGLIKEGKKLVPGGEIIGGFIDEDSLSTTLGEWAEFARKKIANKDEVELVLEPEKVLTPLFWKGLAKYANDKKFICLFIDTYEEADTILEKWLLELLDGKYGDIPINIMLIIAGREELNPNTWSDLKDLILKIRLEPFTDKEAYEYLVSKEVNDPDVQEEIKTQSGGLPVLMAFLTDAADKRAGSIEDPAQTAVERFLKWVQDKNQRTIALAAALPRKLNQDIVESLIDDKKQAKSNFEWLIAQPFVMQRDDYWVYHNVVRDQMLRYVRIRSGKEWNALQECLEKYYDEQQKLLGLPANQELLNTKWMEFEHEKEYHQLSYKPDKFTPVIIQQFVRLIYEQGIFRAGVFGETLYVAGKDIDNKMNRNLGKSIVDAIKEYNDENKHELLQKLIINIQANDWIKNHEHKAYLFLIEGITQTDNDAAIKAFRAATELTPGYAEAWYNLGVVYARKREFDEAINAYEVAIGLQPDYIAAYNGVGLIYANQEKYDLAVPAFQNIIDLNPEDKDAWYNLGSSYYYLNQFDKAIETLEKALIINPVDFQAYNNLGLSYYNKQEYDKAIGCYDKALALKADYYLAHYNMGLALSRKKEFEKAIQSYQNTIFHKSDYYSALFKMGEAYFSLDQPDNSITAYQQTLAIKPDYADGWYNLGNAYIVKNDPDKAIEAFTKAVALKPDDYEAWFHIGMQYGNKKMYKQSADAYEKSVAIKPEYQAAVSNLGWAYVNNGDYDKAIEVCQKAAELDATDYRAFSNLGRAYSNKKNFGEAIKWYLQSLTVNPEDSMSYGNLGYCYLQIPDYDLAIPALEKCISLNERDVNAICDLGFAYMAKDREDEAIEQYKKAIDIEPGYDVPNMNLGYIYLKNGKPDEAEVLLLKAKQLGKDAYTHMNVGHLYLVKGNEANAMESYEEGLSLAAGEEKYFNDLNADYEILKQYGIAQDYYESLIKKIKRPVKTPAAH